MAARARRDGLLALFRAAVAAVSADACLPRHLPDPPKGRTLVAGAGKASAAMAKALEDHWPAPLSGMVVTRFGHAADCNRITVREAEHPQVGTAGLQAANAMLDLVRGLTADDLVVALISGGGSALLPCPAEGLTLDDEKSVNRALVNSGASISAMNCVRKHISRIKGGRLAFAAYPAAVVSLIVSDIPGDIASDVASGPTVPDPTTVAEALSYLEKYVPDAPDAVFAHLRGGHDETPKPGDDKMARNQVRIIARAHDALEAARSAAEAQGITPVMLGDDIQGEAREVGRLHARLALDCVNGTGPAAPPCVLLSGGETTVSVKGKGRGGRNAEYALALAMALGGRADIHALAADTDGIDGTEDNAGAVVTPDTLARARRLGLDPAAYLENNDAYSFFDVLGDLVVTGPTLTNVNDFRAIWIDRHD